MLVTTLETGLTPEQLVEQLLALPDGDAQKQLIQAHVAQFSPEEVAEQLKTVSDRYIRSDLQRARQTAQLLTQLGDLTGNLCSRALGLLAEANVQSVGLRNYQNAIELSVESAEIYGQQHRPVLQARAKTAQIFPLSCLGQYENAVKTAEQILKVFSEHNVWYQLIVTTTNLSIVHSRHGEDAKALETLDQANIFCLRLESGRERHQALIQLNRAVSLRNLGRFDEAITANQTAYTLFNQLGQTVEAARSRQSLAMIYYVLSRYNEALAHLDQAQTVFIKDGRQRDAMLAELFISDCLLQLRRYQDVLDKCQQVRRLFGELGEKRVMAQAFINEAVAYTNLERHVDALTSLQDAYQIFQNEDNQVWMAMTQLEMAAVLQRQGSQTESIAILHVILPVFAAHALVVEEAQAHLLAARAALTLDQHDQALVLINKVIAVGTAKNLPSLTYYGQQLLGQLAEAQGDLTQAMTRYDQAIQAVERLRGRLMVEFRADFLADKQAVYEQAVRLCLTTNQAQLGLDYAERAKSRSLLDLLAYRLDLSIQVRQATDQPLVEELVAMRSERDRLYRRWESSEDLQLRGRMASDGEQVQMQQEILSLEKRITDLWHKLLIHNADYARDAALWQVRTEPVQPYLPANTVLLEYFIADGEILVFVVTANSVTAHALACQQTQVQQLLQLWQVNLNRVPRSTASQTVKLIANAKVLLQRLYTLLIGPISACLTPHQRLIIVPHGPLHYLPFHALFDGERYLLEQYELSYLPGASLLRYCREVKPASSGAFIYGHSLQGKLPNTLYEATMIATILGESVTLEAATDVAQLQSQMAACRIIHLATHGDFRADNPLFSGLVIGDGWLTTLDIFNLRLQASLVTLSACQTGRNVIQGGDELAGLMKAFLSAGAASLVLSYWAVEDRTTAELMEVFYQHLAAGLSKGAALRAAQLGFMRVQLVDDSLAEARKHPYFWAPFFLVGDSGAL